MVLPVPEGHTAIVVVLKGTVQSNGSEVLREAEIHQAIADFQNGKFGMLNR